MSSDAHTLAGKGCIAERTRDGRLCFFYSDQVAFQDACDELVNEDSASFGLPGTGGDPLTNYITYVCNQHPVLSIFLQHPLHSFRPWKRVVVLITCNCWAFFVAACFAVQSHRHHLHWYVQSIITSLLTLPYEVFLEYVATCEGQRQNTACLCCGSIYLLLLALNGILWLVIGLGLIYTHHHPGFVPSYVNSIWQELLLWIPFNIPYFLYKYLAASRGFSKKYSPGVVSIEYSPATVLAFTQPPTGAGGGGRSGSSSFHAVVINDRI